MKERLTELICDASEKELSVPYMSAAGAEALADYLLANGVIVPPFDIGTEIEGEVVHEIEYHKDLLSSGEIRTRKKVHTCNKEDVGKTMFCSHPMTWEEAEQALQKKG